MPVSERDVIRRFPHFFVLLSLVAISTAMPARAVENTSPMHWSGDRTLWDRKANHVELFGHAAVHQPGESLTADYIALDLNSRMLDAKGNCVYIASGTVIHGEEMHFNLDTRTGSIIGGRVSSDRFTLTGDRINKLSASRFQTHRGEYSTCRDCPESWAFRGEDVDMEFEGYAFMSNVTAKIKDTPILWLPYLIVPLKTKRQTGFLFPRFGASERGFRYVQPFFWAINRSSDMTIGVGDYGGQGRRLEWEGRYQLTKRSGAQVDFYYLDDRVFESYLSSLGEPSTSHRWGLTATQLQELPFDIDEKLRIVEMRDNLYPSQIGDVPGNTEAFVSSDFILSHSTNQVSSYVATRRIRNLLDPNLLEFSPSTVQVLPTAAITTNNKFLFDAPVAVGITVGMTNFTRSAGPFDQYPADPVTYPLDVYNPGVDPLREATRFSLTPSMYATLRPWDVMSVVPSLEYRGFFYSFHSAAPNLERGYLLFQTDVSTQLEKIYTTSDPDIPRVKHLIRPMLTYSLIPYSQESDGNHPFLQQIEFAKANNFTGFNFDDYDIVPRDTSRDPANYFLPLGNSLSYGFTTQLVRRRGPVESEFAGYQRSVELSAGQTYNFRELRSTVQNPQPFSRFFSSLRLEYDHFTSATDYTYVPYIPIDENNRRHFISTSLTYILDRSLHQRILTFDRSITLAYDYGMSTAAQTSNLRGTLAYSLSDYLLPSASVSYNFVTKVAQEYTANFRFQSPSQCWSLALGASRTICPPQKPTDTGVCYNYTLDLGLNLTGSGFGGVSDVANTAGAK